MGSQGNTTVDFGAFPGSNDVTITITGQAGIIAGSCCEAWIRGEDSADHTIDEHLVETIECRAHTINPGTGFSITAFNTSQLLEPLEFAGSKSSPYNTLGKAAQIVGSVVATTGTNGAFSAGSKGTRLYGVWNVSWCWN